MKTLAALFWILLVCSLPVTASPASPIWSASIGMDELNSYYFSNNFEPINKLFQANGTKILMLNSPTVNGARYSIGYGVSRNTVLGYEQIQGIGGWRVLNRIKANKCGFFRAKQGVFNCTTESIR